MPVQFTDWTTTFFSEIDKNDRKIIPLKLHTAMAEEKKSLETRRHKIMVTLQIQKCDISCC
jgi:hypothetical protein